MSSVIDICNLALVDLGASTIASLSENSTEARACYSYYDITRKTTLRDHPWSFATKFKSLSLLSGEDDKPGWDYIYLYPTDCLYLLGLYELDSSAKVRRSNHDYERTLSDAGNNNVILTNVENAYMKYVVNIELTSLFPSDYILMLRTLLAANICQSITGDMKLKDKLYSYYLEGLRKAKIADAQENNNQPVPEDKYMNARR